MPLPWQACNADLVQPADLQLQVHPLSPQEELAAAAHMVPTKAGRGGWMPASLLLRLWNPWLTLLCNGCLPQSCIASPAMGCPADRPQSGSLYTCCSA